MARRRFYVPAAPSPTRERCSGWARHRNFVCVLNRLPSLVFGVLIPDQQRNFKLVGILGFVTILQATVCMK